MYIYKSPVWYIKNDGLPYEYVIIRFHNYIYIYVCMYVCMCIYIYMGVSWNRGTPVIIHILMGFQGGPLIPGHPYSESTMKSMPWSEAEAMGEAEAEQDGQCHGGFIQKLRTDKRRLWWFTHGKDYNIHQLLNDRCWRKIPYFWAAHSRMSWIQPSTWKRKRYKPSRHGMIGAPVERPSMF